MNVQWPIGNVCAVRTYIHQPQDCLCPITGKYCTACHVPTVQEGKKQWDFWYNYLHRGCMHGNECIRRKRYGHCNFGARFYSKHLIAGWCQAAAPLNDTSHYMIHHTSYIILYDVSYISYISYIWWQGDGIHRQWCPASAHQWRRSARMGTCPSCKPCKPPPLLPECTCALCRFSTLLTHAMALGRTHVLTQRCTWT